MSLSDIYFKLEDKFYDMTDAIDNAGIPIYSIIDPIENAGIPSFPLTIAVVLIIIALAGYFFMGAAPAGGGEVGIQISANGELRQGAIVKASQEGAEKTSGTTNKEGMVGLSLNSDETYKIEVTAEGCTTYREAVKPSEEALPLSFTLQCAEGGEEEACFGISKSIEVTQLQGPQGFPPEDCAVRVHKKDGGAVPLNWNATNGKLRINEPSDTCPPKKSDVIIDCNTLEYKGTISTMLEELSLYGSLEMTEKTDQAEQEEEGEEAHSLISADIKTMSTQGVPLEGIVVKTVDEEGNKLDLGFENTVTETTTGPNGNAIIKLPSGQDFWIQANDPQGAYQSISPDNMYTATSTQAQQTISVTLSRGYETTIIAKEKATQNPIRNAKISVKTNEKTITQGYTNGEGKFVTTLIKNQQYTTNVRHPQYGSKSVQLQGGGTKTVYLEEIDQTKAGTLTVDVKSSHDLKESFSDVKLELVSTKNNTVWMEKTTGPDGRAYFENVMRGDYFLKALPPGGVRYQKFDQFSISARNTTQKQLEVTPAQRDITVKTEIYSENVDRPIRKQGVRVELWDQNYQERIGVRQSGKTRKVKFTVDRERRIFLIAEFVDNQGTKYGPLKTSPFKPLQDEEKTLTLQTISETVNLEAPNQIIAGKERTAELHLSLPRYKVQQNYQNAYIEFFTGTPGNLGSLQKTPVVVNPVSLSDFASQDPYIDSIKKSNEYSYGTEPSPDKTGTSKYLKVNVAQYQDPTTYTIDIPLYAKAMASGKTKLSYRAVWTTPEGNEVTSHQGKWKEKQIEVFPSQTNQYHELETGPFYSYSSWLTETKTGSPQQKISTTKNSYFYSHLKAKARTRTDRWGLKVTNIPDNAEGVSYEGRVVKEGSTIPIPKTSVSGSDFKIESTDPAYSLTKDDVVEFTITMQAKEEGEASLALFNDFNNALEYTVTGKSKEEETIVSGVTAALTTKSNFCTRHYDNQQGDCWYSYNPEEETLPANSKDLKFITNLQASESRKVNVKFQGGQSIEFTENEQNTLLKQVEAPEEIEIDAEGTAITNEKLNVFIWEQGTQQPTEPWAQVTYGPTDYKMSTTPIDNGKVKQSYSQQTDEIRITVTKETAQIIENVGANVLKRNRVKLTSPGWSESRYAYLDNQQEQNVFTLSIDPEKTLEQNVKITAESDKFGKIEEEKSVKSISFEPEFPHFFQESVAIRKETRPNTITISSTWDKPISVSASELKRTGFKITQTAKTFYSGGNDVKETIEDTSNITIPPEGKAKISIVGKATDAKCRLQQPVSVIDLDVQEVPGTKHYSFEFNCTVGEQPEKQIQTVKSYFIRETESPALVNRFSCPVDTRQGKYAYICDSQQLGIALGDAADDLLEHRQVVNHTYYYAFGNDRLTALELREIAKDHDFDHIINAYGKKESAAKTAASDLVLDGKIDCGVIKATVEKINNDNDVKINFEKTGDATWCSRTGSNEEMATYFMSLLNYNRDLRPNLGKFYSFAQDTDAELMVKGLQEARKKGNQIKNSMLFSYDSEGISPGTLISSRTGGAASSKIYYKECALNNAAGCPEFARNSFTQPAIGYLNVNQFNDVKIGMVYNVSSITRQELREYRALYMTRLAQLASGDTVNAQFSSTAWSFTVKANGEKGLIYNPADDDNKEQVVDLTAPEITEFKLKGEDFYGEPNKELTGKTDLKAKIKANGDISYCTIVNVKPNGEETEGKNVSGFKPFGDQKTVLADFKILSGSGIKTARAWCYEHGVPSHKKGDGIVLDESGLKLIPALPSLYTLDFKSERFPNLGAIKNVRSRYSQPDYCWMELSNYDKPTEGEMQAEATKNTICGNDEDENANGYQDDGCGCTTIHKEDEKDEESCGPFPEGAANEGIFFYTTPVHFQTPVITNEMATEKIETEVYCRNKAGNEQEMLTKDGKTMKLYKWSQQVPDFKLPEDLTLALPDLPDVREESFRIYQTDSDLVKERDINPATIISKERGFTIKATGDIIEPTDSNGAEPTDSNGAENGEDSRIFKLTFRVTDEDGIEEGEESFDVKSDYWKEDHTGRMTDDSNSFGSTSCNAEPVTPGDLTEHKVTCPIKMVNNSVNDITVTGKDRRDNTRTETFKVIWDQNPPRINDLSMNPLGKLVLQENEGPLRDMSPKISFTVTDRYTPIGGCDARLNFGAEAADYLSYGCKLKPKTQVKNQPNKAKVVCDYKNITDDKTAHWPLLLLDMSNPVTIDCWDGLLNRNIKNIEDTGKGLKGIDATEVSDIVVKACKLVRKDSSAEEIQKAGFRDVGEEGSIELKEHHTSGADIDEDGVYISVVVTGEDSMEVVEPGKDEKGEIAKAVKNRLHNMKIPSWSIDCATGGICLGGIQAAIRAASAACAETGGTGCREAAKETTSESSKASTKEGSKASSEAMEKTLTEEKANYLRQFLHGSRDAGETAGGEAVSGEETTKLFNFLEGETETVGGEFRISVPEWSKGMEEGIEEGTKITIETESASGSSLKGLVKALGGKGWRAVKAGGYKGASAGKSIASAGKGIGSVGKGALKRGLSKLSYLVTNPLSLSSRVAKIGFISGAAEKIGIGLTVVRGAAYVSIEHTMGPAVEEVAGRYKTGDECEYSTEKPWASPKALGVATELGAAMVCPGCLAFKIALPDKWDALICEPESGEISRKDDESPRRYIINAKGGRKDMGAGGPMAGALSICTESCNDYVCIVSIAEEPEAPFR